MGILMHFGVAKTQYNHFWKAIWNYGNKVNEMFTTSDPNIPLLGL